jgi:xylulokinase
MTRLAGEAPPGADGLFFLPYLVGERTPHMNPDACAAFIGLTLRHGLPHMARAVMEGVAFSLRQGLDIMARGEVSIERLVATGGVIKSDLWVQMLADILRIPVMRAEQTEAAAFGAALLAGAGVGAFQNAFDACEKAVRFLPDVVFPNAVHVERYETQYGLFCDLYPAVEKFMGVASTLGRSS